MASELHTTRAGTDNRPILTRLACGTWRLEKARGMVICPIIVEQAHVMWSNNSQCVFEGACRS